ncbi:hypothetical protein F5148DRAFT_1279109 [Russula earlei]|uniref:Uncharacterized protein n=1 Tax=Russula earlei TaxID=71964 RepID=A0ACC0UPB7_9AGAM|nr:hypothetical protein F5148DRAFT_1279109 [Russula earlei]
MHIIACAIISLIAGNFGDDDLGQILNAQLDTLAISPQAKQAIIPTLFGISKLIEVQSQGIPMPQLQFQPVSASLCSNSKVAMNTHPTGSLVLYQKHQHPFTSNSGSGYTTWLSGKPNTNIPSPHMVPEAKTGDLYVHFSMSVMNHLPERAPEGHFLMRGNPASMVSPCSHVQKG